MIRVDCRDLKTFIEIEKNDFSHFVKLVNSALNQHRDIVGLRQTQIDYDDGMKPYSKNDYMSILTASAGRLSSDRALKQNINFANDINTKHADMFVGHSPFLAQSDANESEEKKIVKFNMALRQANWQFSFREMVRKCVSCGVGYYLAHNKADDKFARFSSLDPTTTLVACDKTIDPDSLFAVYYVYEGKNYIHYVYTSSKIYIFDSKSAYKLGNLIEEQDHWFERVPVTEFPNNHRQLGDAFYSLGLIDLYCATLNDGIKGFRERMNSLLVLKNVLIGNEAELERFKKYLQENVLPVSSSGGEDADAKFIQTEFDINTPKQLLDLLESKIYQLSPTFNYGNPASLQSMGAPALQLMLKPMLDSAEAKENYYTPKLKRVFKCALSYAKHMNNDIKLDVDKIDVVYSHPLPNNDQQAIANAVNLASAGLLNKKYALRTISWIRNHDAYLQGITDKSIEQQIKELEGNNEYNRNKQNENVLDPSKQGDNPDNMVAMAGNRKIDPNNK